MPTCSINGHLLPIHSFRCIVGLFLMTIFNVFAVNQGAFVVVSNIPDFYDVQIARFSDEPVGI